MPDSPKATYGGVVFKEKIKVLTDKLNLPTATYADIWEKQHAKAFVVAGAMQDDLLTDLKSAVLKAVDGSSTLEDFRKDFDKTIAKHGWDYNGSRNWRTRVIYQTNTRMAYSAGRYQQMQAVKRSRPYWQYEHSFATNPRPQHLAWDGMVLMADDPWWNTHYPTNGYGCDCKVRTLSQRDMDNKGLKLAKSPKVVWTEKVIGVTTNPRVVKVIDGIDPGFAYNPGKAVWGEQLAKVTYDKEIAKLKNQSKWQSLDKTDWETYGLSKELAFKEVSGVTKVDTTQDMTEALTELMGGHERVFDVAGKAVLINAAFMASHLPDNRAEFLPLLIEALNDPHEVWQTFEYHKVSKQVAIKRRVISAYTLNGTAINVVLSVKDGVLIGWTVVPLRYNRINKLRNGALVFSK